MGIISFLLSMIAGISVWSVSKEKCKSESIKLIEEFDKKSVKISKNFVDSYIICSNSQVGLRSVLLHLTLSSSFIAIIFFSIILICIRNKEE